MSADATESESRTMPTKSASHERAVDAAVAIRCPIERVFEFYRHFENLPRFLGDVMAVEQIGPTISRWTIQGPLGIRVNWRVKVTEERANELIRYETDALPGLRTHWEVHFTPGPEAGETRVREVMKPALGKFGRAALALVGKFPVEEVKANLHRLKQFMETGKVTDTRYSVRGKFADQ
jgi:uncharacterized membrane protein